MTRCEKCHRVLKNPPILIDGARFGPKCAKAVKEIPAVERDLFYAAELVSQEIADRHLAEMRQGFAAARRRLGVWSAQ